MRMYDVIKKKRDGAALSEEEIRFFVEGYVAGQIPDYQAAALCMAIYFRGRTAEETTALTLAIRDSGDRLDFSEIHGVRVDKHSTGGVGDKTSLVVAPVVATLGAKVAKMSGRGLGHTGGTIDKLEAIPGFSTSLSNENFIKTVNKTGLAIVGQSANLAPADKLLYALRDVTATVDSMPLIASSIMGKKLAADDDCIVLDVKCGSGAFMKSREDSRALAELMVDIGKRAGKKMCALITDMDTPLGYAIGNSLEVAEAVDTLCGKGPEDLTELCVMLAARMLFLAEHGTLAECEADVRRVIASGEALETLVRMVEAQGGDSAYIKDPAKLLNATHCREVCAEQSGYISSINAEGYGIASLLLGAGRNTKEDTIDLSAGIRMHAKPGDFVKAGEVIAYLYTTDRADRFDDSAKQLLASTVFSAEPPVQNPLVLDIVE